MVAISSVLVTNVDILRSAWWDEPSMRSKTYSVERVSTVQFQWDGKLVNQVFASEPITNWSVLEIREVNWVPYVTPKINTNLTNGWFIGTNVWQPSPFHR